MSTLHVNASAPSWGTGPLLSDQWDNGDLSAVKVLHQRFNKHRRVKIKGDLSDLQSDGIFKGRISCWSSGCSYDTLRLSCLSLMDLCLCVSPSARDRWCDRRAHSRTHLVAPVVAAWCLTGPTSEMADLSAAFKPGRGFLCQMPTLTSPLR